MPQPKAAHKSAVPANRMPTWPNAAQRTLKLHSGVLWGFLRMLGSLSAASPAGCKAAGSGANPQGGKQNGGGVPAPKVLQEPANVRPLHPGDAAQTLCGLCALRSGKV